MSPTPVPKWINVHTATYDTASMAVNNRERKTCSRSIYRVKDSRRLEPVLFALQDERTNQSAAVSKNKITSKQRQNAINREARISQE